MTLRFVKERDKDNRFDNVDLVMTCDDVTLPEILDNFAAFLRGCGFVLNGIQLTDVDE